MRHTSHAVPDAAASAVEMPHAPAAPLRRSGPGQPRQQEIQRPSAVQRADRQQIEGAQHPVGPRRRGTPHPAEDRSRQQIRPTAPPEPPPTPARSPWPPGPRSPLPTCRPAAAGPPRRRALKPADARTRATLPPPAPSAPSANRSRGRTIPPAEKSRRRRYTQAVST